MTITLVHASDCRQVIYVLNTIFNADAVTRSKNHICCKQLLFMKPREVFNIVLHT